MCHLQKQRDVFVNCTSMWFEFEMRWATQNVSNLMKYYIYDYDGGNDDIKNEINTIIQCIWVCYSVDILLSL